MLPNKFCYAVLVVAFLITSITALNAQKVRREVAVTFDDLPFVSTNRDFEFRKQMTGKLLTTLKTNQIPVIGFVNERQLYVDDKLDQKWVGLLREWLNAGMDLGNHTFAHHSLNSYPLSNYEAEVVRGEMVTRQLLKEKGKQLKYFRHPFLQTGRSLEIKSQFENFLKQHGYQVAPVTIDNSEWIFARAYDNARDANDSVAMKQVADAYVPYMEAKFAFYENQSQKLFGRTIKHVLLVHANAINADHFGDIISMLQKRGYEFTTLRDALTDEAYSSDDKYIGPAGITWIDRWAFTRGVPKDFFNGEPRTPGFIMQLAHVDSE
ncbi:MAG TPA: polysaccharide deacetylase family protein [Pyrinomonadaceae bacterium]|nr:polysaccharide deacetylase family protein [Pyrinomonadaceae bacterium]